MIKLQLPTSLIAHPVALKLSEYISSMNSSSTFFSTIVYDDGKEYQFLNKDGDFPFVEFDWLMYCCMRSWAKTIISTGPLLRKEPNIYSDERGAYGNEEIKKMYEQNIKERQNLMILSNQMDFSSINQMISQKYFNLVDPSKVLNEGISVYQAVRKFEQMKEGPIILENGKKSLKEYLEYINLKGVGTVQMMILSVFSGYMPKRYIEEPFQTSWFEGYLEKVWASDCFETKVKDENGGIHKGELKFIVYLAKNK